MYFPLDEFFLQRTQQYTHIENLVNAPISIIGLEKDITVGKPDGTIEGGLSLWQPSLFTHLCAVRRLNTTKLNSRQSDN